MSKRILVIGGGLRSSALLRFLETSIDYRVVGVCDEKEQSSLIREARMAAIPTTDDWRSFLKKGLCDAVLNITGDEAVNVQLQKEAGPLGIEVMGQTTANIIWGLLRQTWARDVFDRLQSKIEPSWALGEILILLLESARKLTSASSGIIFVGDKGKITDRISWGVSGEVCDSAISKIGDYEKTIKDFYPEFNPSYFIPLFENGMPFGGIVLFSIKSEVDEKIIKLIQDKVSAIILHTRTLHRTIKLSNIDGLTDLFNHRSFHERMEKEIYRAQQYDLNFSMIILDIDDFKKFNDDYGHLVGDRQLKALAKILRFILRETDFIARYGGEEFAVVLPETPLEGAVAAAERLRSAVEKQDFGKGMKSTVSIGVSAYPDHGVKKNDIIDKADKALYEAKAKGKNRVCVAT